MGNKPATDHDWTIHSINIHGIFFERWCQKTIEDTHIWKIKSTNYPVEYPPPNGPIRGRESTLDIRAELQQNDLRLTLLIECKKNNPEFVNWIFFPKRTQPTGRPVVLSQIENTVREAPHTGWTSQIALNWADTSLIVADEARETRGSYTQHHQRSDKTKTSNAAIIDAAHQVALAHQAIVAEESKFSNALGFNGTPHPMPWKKQVFMPTIVTSAHIFTCDFDTSYVDPKTGEIPLERAALAEQAYLFLEYPLPRHLQTSPANLIDALSSDSIELFTRLHIIVVHSENLATVLRDLAGGIQKVFR